MDYNEQLKNFLILQICKIRKQLGIDQVLINSDYKINNLKKIYFDLTEQIDIFDYKQ